jgi:hypothetical protein
VASVTWTCDKGGSGTAVGGASWSIIGIALTLGANVITVSAHDAAGNIGQDTITVTYAITDTTAPTVVITSPTSDATYTSYNVQISLSGTASDDTAVTSVTWSCSTGGSGTATGTDAWSISGIVLTSGANVITVTGHDAAGNTGTDSITVTYTTSVRVSRYLVGGYGNTYVYNASWGAAGGSQYTSPQHTDDGTAITSYVLTRRAGDPLKSAQKTAQMIFVTVNIVGSGDVEYASFTDNNHTSTPTHTHTIAMASGYTDTIVGEGIKHRKLQHYLEDSIQAPVEYISILENGDVDKVI